jgi:hypothetical protein
LLLAVVLAGAGFAAGHAIGSGGGSSDRGGRLPAAHIERLSQRSSVVGLAQMGALPELVQASGAGSGNTSQPRVARTSQPQAQSSTGAPSPSPTPGPTPGQTNSTPTSTTPNFGFKPYQP